MTLQLGRTGSHSDLFESSPPSQTPPSAEIEAIRQRLLRTENRIRARRAVCSRRCHPADGSG